MKDRRYTLNTSCIQCCVQQFDEGGGRQGGGQEKRGGGAGEEGGGVLSGAGRIDARKFVSPLSAAAQAWSSRQRRQRQRLTWLPVFAGCCIISPTVNAFATRIHRIQQCALLCRCCESHSLTLTARVLIFLCLCCNVLAATHGCLHLLLSTACVVVPSLHFIFPLLQHEPLLPEIACFLQQLELPCCTACLQVMVAEVHD